MSKNQMIKTIKSEIDALNWKIDLKIIQGQPYKAEAKRHKFLVSQWKTLTAARAGFGLFGKVFA
ncbi:MAG TPA: hypothetical protein VIR98_02940 [Candidatus Paceibacterota bacterium]|jgi:hypothetical protein